MDLAADITITVDILRRECTVRGGRILVTIAAIGLGVRVADIGYAIANELNAEVAALQIQNALSGIVAVTGVRLSRVIEPRRIYADLEHQGYVRRKGDCETSPVRSDVIACSYELTDRGQIYVAPEASRHIRRASMYSCAGIEGCTEVTWIIGSFKLNLVSGIAMARDNGRSLNRPGCRVKSDRKNFVSDHEREADNASPVFRSAGDG